MPNTHKGYTFIETVTALAVAMILFAVAAPNFASIIRTNELVSSVNDIVRAVNLTRTEAIRTGGSSSLCASSDQISCNSSNWQDGWILFSDFNGNGVIDSNSNDAIVLVNNSLPPAVIIKASNTSRLTFTSDGFLPPGFNASFDICSKLGSGIKGRNIMVNAVGRPNTSYFNGC